ncbi:MAG: response regulator, partial [Gemmatimonadales bacterium]|nr:response regulator [Gemmatimonadales bacterium]
MEILLVEDHVLVAGAIQAHLRIRGHEVHCAHSVHEFRRAAAESEISIVVLDVNLPDGNGIEAVVELQTGGLEASVIVLSGHAPNRRSIAQIRRLIGVIEKSAPLRELDGLVDAVVERSGRDLRRRSTKDHALILSRKKVQLLALLANGSDLTDSAVALGIRPSTATEHIQWLKRRLGVSTTAQLVAEAITHGFIVRGPAEAGVSLAGGGGGVATESDTDLTATTPIPLDYKVGAPGPTGPS